MNVNCSPFISTALLGVLLISSVSLLAHPTDSTKYKRFRITPLPAISYSPETKLGFGAVVAINFDVQKIPDSLTRTSYSQTYFLYTLNKQHDIGHMTRMYFAQNRYVAQVNINLLFFPEYYYGVSTEYPLLNTDTIEYNRTTVFTRFYAHVKNNWYIGFSTRYQKIDNVNSDPGGSFNENPPLGSNGYRAFGFAPSLALESRDSQVYPRAGWFIEALFFMYPKWGDGYPGFNSLRIDARKYYKIQLTSKRDALAFQFLSVINVGNVPFKDMADVGGSRIMRGYYSGFYRYMNSYAFQVELRLGLGKLLGLNAWTGAALASDGLSDFFDQSIKPNAGVGLRFMINRGDQLNLRMDQGYGNKGQRGFYLDLAEAF